MIPLVDLTAQYRSIKSEIDNAIKECIDETNFIKGKAVTIFEKSFADYLGMECCVGCGNGTDALEIILSALNIGPGDEVLVPALTWISTAEAVTNVGAEPVFVDIDPQSYTIDYAKIPEKLTKRTKAIIPVHLYGCPADMNEIKKIADKHGLFVIEDCAQAHGAEYYGRKIGTFGIASAVSFFPSKNLGAFGDAGLILTNNKAVAEKLMILRNQGNKDKYYHLVLGRNNRLDAIQAVVLDIKLKYLDGWNKERQKIAGYYNRNLAGLDIKLPIVSAYSTHIYHQYVLRGAVSNKLYLDHLQAKGIDSRVFYPVPLHLQKCFKYLGYKAGDFKEAEAASRQVFTLPIYPDLTDEEKDYIIQSVGEFKHG